MKKKENAQHRTPNVQRQIRTRPLYFCHSVFGVRCSVFAAILMLAGITARASDLPPVASSAKEASHVLAAAPGSLVSLTVTSDSDQYILIIDSATVPADGAVTLLCPPIHVAAASTVMINFPVPLRAVNGISVCNSNANSFTKTIGAANCIFAGQVILR
jgi:hypothetical protein